MQKLKTFKKTLGCTSVLKKKIKTLKNTLLLITTCAENDNVCLTTDLGTMSKLFALLLRLLFLLMLSR
jgi:hypothetical protein